MKLRSPLASIVALGLLAALPFGMSAQEKPTPIKFTKYDCTASKYRNGFYEYIARGSFVITKEGKYSYSGFQKESTGKFSVDQQGNLHFKDGYFDGGKAEKIDRPNKVFLVFPANPDNRWTCSCSDS
ncbi:hypothetical protein ACFPMF_18200 [Larkinella bovis]|uniref:Uncharacterized protein n=1 Tax=Larkinella bovis TaxID=683041 RepID=A0ABW0IEB1_9BACT